MTDEELLRILKEMQDMFPQSLPNPEQEPRRFAYYVKLYQYYKGRQ
jgi:hypothetical protein